MTLLEGIAVMVAIFCLSQNIRQDTMIECNRMAYEKFRIDECALLVPHYSNRRLDDDLMRYFNTTK